jgi:hypothetical protein
MSVTVFRVLSDEKQSEHFFSKTETEPKVFDSAPSIERRPHVLKIDTGLTFKFCVEGGEVDLYLHLVTIIKVHNHIPNTGKKRERQVIHFALYSKMK